MGRTEETRGREGYIISLRDNVDGLGRVDVDGDHLSLLGVSLLLLLAALILLLAARVNELNVAALLEGLNDGDELASEHNAAGLGEDDDKDDDGGDEDTTRRDNEKNNSITTQEIKANVVRYIQPLMCDC